MSFKKLSEVNQSETNLLTVLSGSVVLNSAELNIEIDKDPFVLTSSKERREHAEQAMSSSISKQIDLHLENGRGVLLATPGLPLEILTADVSVVLISENRKYVVSFLRNIWPVGWLVPGGCPSFYQEIFDPSSVAHRELREELIIMDKDGVVYSLGLSETAILRILDGYRIEPKEIQSLKIRPIEATPGHANQIRIVRPDHDDAIINKVNVMVDPMTASVAVTIYVEIDLPLPIDQLKLLDGEILPNGQVLNRAVRLTHRFLLKEKEEVVAYFVSGNNLMTQGWINKCVAARVKHPSI